MNISIIIPCFNEAENIIDTVNMVINNIDDSVSDYEVILVDDGSGDNSREIINRLLETNGKIRALFHKENFGKGAALRSGFEQARMDWILTMDADLQIDISELKHFLPFCRDYDLITGFRIGRKEGFSRSIVSEIYNFVVSVVIGAQIHDVGCPFKLLKTEHVKNLDITSRGFAVDAEIFNIFMLHKYRIKEVSVNCRPRIKGKSTVKFRHYIKTFIELIRLKINKINTH